MGGRAGELALLRKSFGKNRRKREMAQR
jgi:hypothetical protein